ncbi:MAG: methylenetetrahydrofolate reductase [Porticoccaceae bacterium]|nr:methylenetetrahydrofolate reductase [Porticoccaceae bacterium]MDG1474865.1 methylenetetrahydrofolate reductase [Porticoccaceae bacterium]
MPPSMVEEKQALVDMMLKTTLEVTPGGAAKVADFGPILRPGCTVYVTFLPGSDFAETLTTVRRLKSDGYNPVPHFAARSIVSSAILEENLAALQHEGVSEGLLIGGGVDKPLGEFGASIDVLRTGLFEKYSFTKLGVAGHPEGSPDISDGDCAIAIEQKNKYAKNSSMELYLATQFIFEAQPLLAWEKRIRQQGNKLPVHVGIPGLATIKTLLRHAQHCGVGPSMRFLTRSPMNMLRLSLKDSFLGSYLNAPASEPSELVRDLVAGMGKDKDCLIKQLHLYPLGGLAKSAQWMHKVQDGHFQLTGNGFKTL